MPFSGTSPVLQSMIISAIQSVSPTPPTPIQILIWGAIAQAICNYILTTGGTGAVTATGPGIGSAAGVTSGPSVAPVVTANTVVGKLI